MDVILWLTKINRQELFTQVLGHYGRICCKLQIVKCTWQQMYIAACVCFCTVLFDIMVLCWQIQRISLLWVLVDSILVCSQFIIPLQTFFGSVQTPVWSVGWLKFFRYSASFFWMNVCVLYMHVCFSACTCMHVCMYFCHTLWRLMVQDSGGYIEIASARTPVFFPISHLLPYLEIC